MRSGAVPLGVVSAVALALTSCSSNDKPDLRCVDAKTYKQVSNSLCDAQPGGGYAATDLYQWYEYPKNKKGHGSGTGGLGYYGHRYTGPKLSKGSGADRGGFGGHGKSGS